MATKRTELDGVLRPEQEWRRSAGRTRKVGTFALAAVVQLVACTPAAQEQKAATPAEETPAVPAETAPFFLDLRTGETTPLAENLAGGYSYAASPDGLQLAFGTCCSGTDVMTIANIDGSDARTLESPEGLNYYGARWSPDGTKLVYQERNGGGDTALTGDVGNLFVHDLSTGRRTQITDLELSRAWWWFLSPSFSPGGRDVIFHLPRTRSQATTWDAWSVPVNGGEPSLVLRNAAFPMLTGHGPEGEEVAFVEPTASDFAGQSLMTGRLSPQSDIRTPLVETNGSIWWPVLSPDGFRVAYQDGGSIYVADMGSLVWGESSKVADGDNTEWLDDNTLIVSPD
jgi:hypothetical protein